MKNAQAKSSVNIDGNMEGNIIIGDHNNINIPSKIEEQVLARQLGFDKANRKLIRESIKKIRERLDDYEKLFNCEYPELFEFAFAYDALNPKAPFYSDENPIKVYNALVKYKNVRDTLNNKQRIFDEAMDVLEANKIIESEEFEETAFFDIYPNNYIKILSANASSIFEKFKVLSLCDLVVFTDFPQKATRYIEWERLGAIKPQNVRTMIGTRLQSRIDKNGFFSDEIDAAQQDKEVALSEARENLVYFRQKAFQLIQEIGLKLNELEREWIVPE